MRFRIRCLILFLLDPAHDVLVFDVWKFNNELIKLIGVVALFLIGVFVMGMQWDYLGKRFLRKDEQMEFPLAFSNPIGNPVRTVTKYST